jgi:hypothetical protein
MWEHEGEVKGEVAAFQLHPNNMNREDGALLLPERS